MFADALPPRQRHLSLVVSTRRFDIIAGQRPLMPVPPFVVRPRRHSNVIVMPLLMLPRWRLRDAAPGAVCRSALMPARCRAAASGGVTPRICLTARGVMPPAVYVCAMMRQPARYAGAARNAAALRRAAMSERGAAMPPPRCLPLRRCAAFIRMPMICVL